MYTRLAAIPLIALVWSAAAQAGEEPLYQPAPDWIDVAELPADLSGPPIILYDEQRRIEEGELWSYSDRAIRIDNPQMLQAIGTIQASWLPDKGDLLVHRIAIVRDGQEIDVVGQGAHFDVLRRERQLEQRIVDGSLTATLAVPGLRVGDTLRMTYSVTLSDQALDKEVQAFATLPTAPFEAGMARTIMSWPHGAEVRWQAMGNIELPEPVTRGGYDVLTIDLPLPEPPEMPSDAPVRYQLPPMLQAGTFADWREVSAVMAPLYGTEGTIAPGSELAGIVAGIERDNPTDLLRAVAALRVVQDEISYLLDGMEGGNYIPQSPQETWDNRFGDCKAKTMLLLAMLREMGIDAEPTVVASQTGDAVPYLLPTPGAFDHVLVHANIDDREYWLDGTSSGASMAVVEEVPPFHHALPLREGGADLIDMVQRPQETFDQFASITYDQRAGLDLPALFDATWTMTGPTAGQMGGLIGQASEDRIHEVLRNFAASQLGGGLVADTSLTFDEATNTATITASGLINSSWEWDRGRGSRTFNLPTSSFDFRPDRSRAAWRQIPVAVPGPYSEQAELTVLLPEGPAEYALEGRREISETIATVRLDRQATLAGDSLLVVDSIAFPGGEIGPEQVTAERARAARFGSAALMLRAPAGVRRSFDAASRTNRERYAALEEIYARLIADDTEDTAALEHRAWFREVTLDREGALEDRRALTELDGSADTYVALSNTLLTMGRFDEALAAADEAWLLDPTIDRALAQAQVLAFLGRADEGLALLEQQNVDPDNRVAVAMTISELQAIAGRQDEGLAVLQDLLAQRPGDPDMLNARCWYQATWNYRPEELAQICTEAVERADWSPPVLDSRAMGYFRLGRYADALADLNAALSASPGQSESLYMRGQVRLAMGDDGGAEDIVQALARNPSLAPLFARWGIETP